MREIGFSLQRGQKYRAGLVSAASATEASAAPNAVRAYRNLWPVAVLAADVNRFQAVAGRMRGRCSKSVDSRCRCAPTRMARRGVQKPAAPNTPVRLAMPTGAGRGGVLGREVGQHHRCAAARAQRFTGRTPRPTPCLADRVPPPPQASTAPTICCR